MKATAHIHGARVMLKRSPIRKKRTGPPRRGRIISPGFMAMVRERGCILSKRHNHYCDGPTQFHHVRLAGSPRDDTRGIGLCPYLHLHGAGLYSIERLGKRGFEEYWAVDLEVEIQRNRDLWEKFLK